MTNGTHGKIQTVIPAVDIVEAKGAYIVTMDMPGAFKDQISAKIDDGTLHVSAPLIDRFGDAQANETTSEYRREFSLANDVDVHSIDAKYDNGVLTITLNKKIQYLPKEININ